MALLNVAVVVVVVAVLVVIVADLALAATRSALEWRLAPRADAASAALVAVAEGTVDPADAAGPLLRMPTRRRLLLLAQFRGTVAGTAGMRIDATAAVVGVDEVTRRWRHSRRWPRRLHGVRLAAQLGVDLDAGDAITDEHPAVRAAALELLGRHGDANVVPLLLDRLADVSPLVRFAAHDALVARKADAIEPLARHLAKGDERELLRVMAVAAAIGTPALGNAARKHIGHRDAAVRAAAGRVIAVGGSAAAPAVLAELLRDPDERVRAEAAVGIGTLGSWQLAPAVSDALSDRAWIVRRNAALALRELGSPGILFLQEAVESDDRYAGDVARHVLAGHDGRAPAVLGVRT